VTSLQPSVVASEAHLIAGTVLSSYSVRLHKLNQFVTTSTSRVAACSFESLPRRCCNCLKRNECLSADFVIGGIEIVVLIFNVCAPACD
jgi:hypothetical protein